MLYEIIQIKNYNQLLIDVRGLGYLNLSIFISRNIRGRNKFYNI